MKYHFVRCMKSNPPEFNCELCEKRFQCRTGLVWHLKKTHKVSVRERGGGWETEKERGREGGRETEIEVEGRYLHSYAKKTRTYMYGMHIV